MFRIIEYTYLGLDTVKAFPNPWKPDKGGMQDADFITFKNLPEEGTIRIYNVVGEMVKKIDFTAVDDGFSSWDGSNDSGNKVSSGIYITYIEDTNGSHRILKIAYVK